MPPHCLFMSCSFPTKAAYSNGLFRMLVFIVNNKTLKAVSFLNRIATNFAFVDMFGHFVKQFQGISCNEQSITLHYLVIYLRKASIWMMVESVLINFI